MCMYKVKEKGLDLEGVGWKVFKVVGISKAYVTGEYHNTMMPVDTWIKKSFCDSSTKEKMSSIWDYRKGFHVFKSKVAAVAWVDDRSNLVVKKVRYKGGHTLGLSRKWNSDKGKASFYACVVADEICIVREGETK